jgi:hypothetical protein
MTEDAGITWVNLLPEPRGWRRLLPKRWRPKPTGQAGYRYELSDDGTQIAMNVYYRPLGYTMDDPYAYRIEGREP